MLDEKALRKPEWKHGVAIKLGDGQTWMMRKPRLRLVPVEAGDVFKQRPRDAAELGPESDDLLAALFGEAEDGGIDFLTARLTIAVRLLRANYTLTAADIQELLWHERNNDENAEMWRLVDDVIMGESPKAGPAISGSTP
jgi:hypothetical protein